MKSIKFRLMCVLITLWSAVVYSLVHGSISAASYSITLTATSTPTPTPFLLYREAFGLHTEVLPRVLAQLKQLETCKLPCWWGFTVGESKMVDFVQFLDDKALGGGREIVILSQPGDVDGGAAWWHFESTKEGEANLIIEFDGEMGLLTELEIEFYNPAKWVPERDAFFTLSRMLKAMGIYPAVYISSKASVSSFAIVFLYPEKYIDIGYVFDFSDYQIDDKALWSPIRLCPTWKATTKVIIHIQSAQEFAKLMGTATALPPQDSWNNDRWNNNFDVDEHTLIDFFINNPEKCLDTNHLGVKKTATPTQPGK